MTINEAQRFVAGIVGLDSNAEVFASDLDEFHCDAVETDGPRIVVWVRYVLSGVNSELTLARFDNFVDADVFMERLGEMTGVRTRY
jgi:hypothetical protein